MFVALILFVVSLAALVLLPKPAIPRANVVLRTAPAAFAALIQFVGCLVVTVVVPILATPRANASALRTAAVVFVVLILFVVSLAAVVAVAPTVMMMARAFRVTVLNGCELWVELSRWVPMIRSGHSQFIV